jgi:hypothetical protein
VTDYECKLAAARAAADQELARTNDVIDAMTEQLLAQLARGESDVDAWASMTARLLDSDLSLERQRDFAVQAFVAAVLRIAQQRQERGC